MAFTIGIGGPVGAGLSCAAELLRRFQHAPKADGSLSFLVLGDWGRRGAFNQSQVALQVHVHQSWSRQTLSRALWFVSTFLITYINVMIRFVFFNEGNLIIHLGT